MLTNPATVRSSHRICTATTSPAGWPMSSDVGDAMMRGGSPAQEVIDSPTFEKVGHPSFLSIVPLH